MNNFPTLIPGDKLKTLCGLDVEITKVVSDDDGLLNTVVGFISFCGGFFTYRWLSDGKHSTHAGHPLDLDPSTLERAIPISKDPIKEIAAILHSMLGGDSHTINKSDAMKRLEAIYDR